MQLPKGWYTVAASSELGNIPLSVERFGGSYVLWRKHDGAPVMMADLCPHRSAKLSLGAIKNDCIQCPYHGFEFGVDGACTFVPETERPSPNLRVETLPVVERNGFIWAYHGHPPSDEQPPWFSEIDNTFGVAESIHEWPTHITRCIENQLDYAHLPFVHRTTIGKGVQVAGSRRFEFDGNRISMYVSDAAPDVPSIQFIFPSLWLLTISPGRFYQFISFVPMGEGRTRLYLRAYQKFVTAPILRDLVRPIFNISNATILNQDRQVVLSQEPKISVDATEEKLFPSDKAIAHFRSTWKNALLALAVSGCDC